jgi:putative copper export protein
VNAADLVAISLRALAFAAVLQAAGMAIFLWLFHDDLDRSSPRIGALNLFTACAGILLTIGHAVVEPARLTGELRGILDGSLQSMLLASDSGTAVAIRLLGLAMIVSGSIKASRLSGAAALMGASLVITSFAFMGHTAGAEQRWLLAVLLISHLLVIAFWFGALWPLLISTKFEAAALAGLVIEQFSRLAVRLVPIIFLAGVAMAILLLPSISSLRSPYGLLLISKIAGFAILMGLAAANKWRFGPRVASGDRVALQTFRRTVLAEWFLIIVVVTVTATMTEFFSPEH